MKVLLINSVYEYGSTGKIVKELRDFYTKNGIVVYVAYGRNYRKTNDKNIIRVGGKISQFIHLLGSRIFDLSGRLSYFPTLFFLKKINRIKFDIIHIHNLHGYYINYSLIFNFLIKSNIKSIFTLHDSWMLTGHCSNFQNINCEKYKDHCYQCPLTKSYPKSYIDNSTNNFYKKTKIWSIYDEGLIVTPSKWLMYYVYQSKMKNKKIDYIHNGIDIDVFKPTISVGEKSNFILAVSSVWTESKGLYILAEIEESLRDRNLTLVVIGVNNVQKKLFSSRAILINRTNNVNELVKWYNKSMIFINPTLEDNYPTVNLEAISSGTPVITFPTGGSPESIFSDNGIVTKEKSIKSMIEAVDTIRGNYDYYYHNCLKTRITFDKNVYLSKYLEIIKGIDRNGTS